MSFGDIWKTLSAVDCSEHVEKKMGLSYLSWASAWTVLMEHYPESTFELQDERVLDNGTVECRVIVTIDEHSRCMWLPVMDHKNKAIVNPDARAISDCRMRCLVKALGLFGLGMYLYQGLDLPSAEKDVVDPLSSDQQKELVGMCMQGNINLDGFLGWLGYSRIEEVPVTDYNKAKQALEKKLEQLSRQYAEDQDLNHLSDKGTPS